MYLFVLKQLLPTLLPSPIWHTFFSFPHSLVLTDRLHVHLLWDLQARRSLSRAMAASCQARPSVRIVDGRGKLKQTTRPQAFLGRRSHLLIWLCAVHVKIHLVWLNPPPNTLAESDQMASVNLSLQLLGMEFLIPHDSASRSFSGCNYLFQTLGVLDDVSSWAWQSLLAHPRWMTVNINLVSTLQRGW